MKRLNNKGFTLVELFAVMLILGVLVVATIPIFNNIVINSKRTVYAETALIYIKNAKQKIANKEIEKGYNSDVTYYIDVRFLSENTELHSSPFADWVQAYVIYTIDDTGKSKFYFLSLDEHGWMIKRVEEKLIDRDVVVRDLNYISVDIENLDSRETIMMIDPEGFMYETTEMKAWTRDQTKECFSFKDLNDNEVSLTYYNINCLGEDGSVVIPAKVGTKSVTEIHSYTFYNMGIKSVSLPSTIKKIGTSAFSKNQLINLRIPESVTSIGDTAFSSNQLTNLKMTTSVTTIGARAFQHNLLNKPLKQLVPNENTTIGACAFCNNYLPSAAFLYNGNKVRGYVGDLSEFSHDKVFRVPAYNEEGDPITEIANDAFYSMSLNGFTVDIPEGITKIGSHAFTFGGITKVNFPSTLKSIGAHSFYSNGLTTINIPDSVTFIDATAFNNNRVPNAADGWIYKRKSTGGIDPSTIIGYAGAPKNNLVIPAVKDGVPLEKLGPSALTYLGLTGTLKIPETVKEYGNNQVFCSNSLISVDNGYGEVTDGFVYARNSDGTINKNVIFSYAGKNKNPVIPSHVKEIAPYAFYYSYINSISMPEGLTKIGDHAFYVCSLKGTVTIPSTVTEIGAYAFYKAITWNSMNGELTKIINKTNRSFNWQSITAGPSPATFKTGTVENWYGNIEVTAS